jgi:hypothetical protein
MWYRRQLSAIFAVNVLQQVSACTVAITTSAADNGAAYLAYPTPLNFVPFGADRAHHEIISVYVVVAIADV